MRTWSISLALAALVAATGAEAQIKTIAFGSAPLQSLDYYPSTAAGPLVVFVHGGAWISGGRNDYHPLADGLATWGAAVAVVDYRLSGGTSNIHHPEHARDVARGIDFLLAAAEQLRFDSKQVFVIGHSAGAHIAATIATSPEFRKTAQKLAGFVGLEGIYDLPALSKRWPTYRDWFLNLAFGPEKSWRAASPQYHKPTTRAPWLLVHSPKDELVDTDQTKHFAKHLKSAKVPVRLELSSDLNHFGVVQALEKPDSPLARLVKSFLLNPR